MVRKNVGILLIRLIAEMANLEEEEQQNLAKNLADGLSINIKSKLVKTIFNRKILNGFISGRRRRKIRYRCRKRIIEGEPRNQRNNRRLEEY